MYRGIGRAAAVLALLGGVFGGLEAQGVTSAAIVGTVSEVNGGAPIGGASVTLIKPATGETHGVTTRTDGRFVVDNASAGGPYVLTVRAIGYEPVRAEGLRLTLGQRLQHDVDMALSELADAGDVELD